MDIKMYAQVGCKFCTNLEELFRRADLEYTKIVVGQQANQCPMDLFKEKYPEVLGFPFVVSIYVLLNDLEFPYQYLRSYWQP